MSAILPPRTVRRAGRLERQRGKGASGPSRNVVVRYKPEEIDRLEEAAQVAGVVRSELLRRGAQLYADAAEVDELAEQVGVTRSELVLAALQLAQRHVAAGGALPLPTPKDSGQLSLAAIGEATSGT